MSEKKSLCQDDARRAGRILPMLMLLTMVGCATPEQQDSPVVSPSAPVEDEDTGPIKVFFQGKCPRFVDKFDLPIYAKSKKQVEWEAWNLNGTERDEDRKYSVIFDPFAGKTISATSKGKAKSNALKDDVPKGVFFKYTIVSDEDTNCAPLDPFIRLR